MNLERWLRLYPAAWRERYGAELADLLADCSAAGGLRGRDRFDLVLGAVRERCRAACASGAGADERARAGVLWVLVCWAAFVVAGGVLAKFSEHWQDRPTYPASPGTAAVAFDVLRGSAVAGGVAVLIGAGVALPALRGFLRSGGWPAVRRAARPAARLTAVTVAATGGLVAWANGLSAAARNGGDRAYGAAFLGWAGLLVACLVASTVAGIRTARRLTFSRRALRLLAGCSVVVATAIAAATAATLAWWVALARSVPWVLDGSRFGSAGSTAPLVLCGSAALMLLSGLGALVGARRAWRATTARQPLVNVTV